MKLVAVKQWLELSREIYFHNLNKMDEVYSTVICLDNIIEGICR